MRLASVFNATQVDDLPPAPWETESVSPDLLAQQADAWIAATGAQVDVAVSGVFGSYSPSADKITILPANCSTMTPVITARCFTSWPTGTSHESRLNRTLLSARGDKEAYAREELRAEMAAWMICKSAAPALNQEITRVMSRPGCRCSKTIRPKSTGPVGTPARSCSFCCQTRRVRTLDCQARSLRFRACLY